MLKLRMAGRQIVGYSAVLVLMLALTISAVWQVNKIDANLQVITDVNSVKQRHAINYRGSVHDRAIALRDVVLVTDPAVLDKILTHIRELEVFYDTADDALDSLFKDKPDLVTPKDRALLKPIKDIEAVTMPQIAEVIKKRMAGDLGGATKLLIDQVRPNMSTWLARINAFIDHQEAKNKMISDETAATAKEFQAFMLLVLAAALVIGFGFAYWNIRGVRPLRQVTAVMLRLAKDDLSAEVPKAVSADEVGDIIAAVAVFKDNALKVKQLEEEQQRAEAAAAARRRAEMEKLAADFETNVGSIVAAVAGASEQVKSTADVLSLQAEQSRSTALQVAASTDQAAQNVENVTHTAAEMSASIDRIGGQVHQSTAIAANAVDAANRTNAMVQGLAEAAQRVGEVVNLINDIASQTNLLALNATIEAARAGDAGKGFAVVANEVKNLANQTAQATGDISSQIEGMRSATNQAVSAIGEINQIISDMNDITSMVANAVNEQGEATQRIAQNVAEASHGTEEVRHNIGSVTEVAKNTGSSAQEMQAAANDLSAQSSALQRQVTAFINQVRAG